MAIQQPKKVHPRIALIATIAIALGLLLGGGLFALALLVHVVLSTALAIGIVAAITIMLGMTLWGFFVRSQARKKALWLGVWQTTTTGIVPGDARPEVWIPKLESRRRFWKFFRVASPVEFGFFTALGLYLVISAPGEWWSWAELILFALGGIFGFFQAGRQVARIDAALADLGKRGQLMAAPHPSDSPNS
ncbi:hypothetical protein [Frondihabitans sp. PhB188]|uniref:hypothetical protein n=1 Tax=Frondihabitans sp. PhB188 TaxID=2485200 RepID=UPI0011CD5DCA|nr:hypothetical protein [Frondihabitans sp. PhB188]